MDNRLFLFVYAKDGECLVLDTDEAKKQAADLYVQGYTHTVTMSAKEWIQHVLNSKDYEGPNITEARLGIAP